MRTQSSLSVKNVGSPYCQLVKATSVESLHSNRPSVLLSFKPIQSSSVEAADVCFVSTSSCPDGTFKCTTGECLDAGVVCDFKKDCDDGSDEAFCGSCDFEDHQCGWNSTTFYPWTRQWANVTSIPGQDHTSGSPWGHVMSIDGKEKCGFLASAVLEYSMEKTPAVGCQLSFWYYIHYESFPLLSSPIDVIMVRGTDKYELLETEGITKAWQNVRTVLGNRPGGYKLQFSYNCPYYEPTTVMLDDVSFQKCAEGDIPDGFEQLSCHFEEDTCSWFHDYTASILWKRVSGGFQYPEGNGYYMLISSRQSQNISATARLVGFAVGRVICVSFHYHIFGSSIGSLKFIVKRQGEAEDVVWIRSGTQGNKWRFADLAFSSENPIQFIIEAVVGGKQGTISIDDIVVSSKESGSCPPDRECTFQGSFCGLQHVPSADFSWSRITGASQPANSSGPHTDHTLETEHGYYLSAQLWRHSPGSRGQIVTALVDSTPADGECIMFWYFMEGKGVGHLNVYLLTADTSVKLWSRSGNQGTRWRHGRVSLLSLGPYQVMFEAVAGDGRKRDIAIDDMTVQNGVCPPEGFCDFETDFCGWVNNPPAESGIDWDWLSGTEGGSFVPPMDHSTDSSLGHFVLFRSSELDKEVVARLESEWLEGVDQACLELWHWADSWFGNKPSYVNLTVFVNETSGLRQIWSTSGFINYTWIQDKVDYSASGPHQIILQATTQNSHSAFSLDDVHIIKNKSCHGVIPTTTPYPATTTATPDSGVHCTFEEDLCNWLHEVNDDFNWTLSRGLEVDGPWNGPLYDHTVGNNQGFYLLINGSGFSASERASISADVSLSTSKICVGFWYYMLGPSVSRIDLRVETNSSKVLVWTRRGTQNPEWINAQVTINMEEMIRLIFTGQRNSHSEGFLALDDVTVSSGACEKQTVCGFDSDRCGFENDVGHVGQWGRERGTKDNVDHTYGTETGYYMTVFNSNTEQLEIAQLLSPVFNSPVEMCARFWYRLPAGASNMLSVFVWSNELGEPLWQRSGSPSLAWEVAEVTVFWPTKFHVVFQAFHEAGMNSTVKLDDFSVTKGACNPMANCDFEAGPCNWLNTPTEDGHRWVLATGGFHGPPADHTTESPEGHFLLSLSPHATSRSVAQVASEWIRLKDGPACLTLWYYMDGSESGTLRVLVRSDLPEDEVTFRINSSSGHNWKSFSQSLNQSKPFQLLIKAETNKGYFFAIDDISVTPGSCQVNETTPTFVGCTFENDTCGWEDISVGQGQWERGRNATGNAGPSVDHTLGTALGWYVSVTPYHGDHISPAALKSPIMKQASAVCTLKFFYNMYGEDLNELKVVLAESSLTTVLWWQSGGGADAWQLGEVTVGRTHQDFTVLFEATQAFVKPGHVAVDDVTFANCSLPDPQPVCPEYMFRCNNSVCVEKNRVCDFTDDCGDWTDESNCEQQGVTERCSFEQGLCSWDESPLEEPGARWIRQNGQDAWPEAGPPRDHTLNNAAGNYITPGPHLTETGQIFEILSKTLLPSRNCTMRFFYYSMQDATGKLSAQSRMFRSGTDDTVLWFRTTSHSYNWEREDVTFTSSVKCKIVFRYEQGAGSRGHVALDDVSFSEECTFDPDNSPLPDTWPTSPAPTTPATSSAPPSPCQDNEFFCWRSAGETCILSTLKCDYHLDCPEGEDEDGCGPCTFERDQCGWTDLGQSQRMWRRQKATGSAWPPTDHTTSTGFYMSVNSSQASAPSEARLQNSRLPPSSPYCQIMFHFHISAKCAGSLQVLTRHAGGSEAILWSRSRHTVPHWIAESLPLGPHLQPYEVTFSSWNNATRGDTATTTEACVVAVDDISFLNCHRSFHPPALSVFGCTFEEGLCAWTQGADEQLDWLSWSGPTDTPNTGPAGDHTTGKGIYIYIEGSHPSAKGDVAQLKSALLPPAVQQGYCLVFWYHMFGATVGSLRVFLLTAESMEKTLVWQKSGNQGDEWRAAQSHVTLPRVHQVIVEASVEGKAGDIAIDDISLFPGACPASDECDFEEGSCNWQQQSDDDDDWIRQSGPTPNPNTGPENDHTTNAPVGHYYYLPSSNQDISGQTASMLSPVYPPGKGACVQMWYHMYGKGVGTLNVYQQSENGVRALIFSQARDQRRLWRFAQAALQPWLQPYRLVVEGVKAGPTREGDMAFDDVRVSDAECPPRDACDFELNMCSWSNVGGRVDQNDWLRGRGASPNPNTGPGVDHTTNMPYGYYLYVDSSVGQWGDASFLISDVLQPSTRGHCLTFWYHMFGPDVGILRVYINDRKTHDSGNEDGIQKWVEIGNRGDKWLKASVFVEHDSAFWYVFVYQRGELAGGDVALDDISILRGPCYSEPIVDPVVNNTDTLTVGLAVGLTLLAGVIILIFLLRLNSTRCAKGRSSATSDNVLSRNSVFDLFDCRIKGTEHGSVSDMSFFNNLYNGAACETDTTSSA
ncbi:MAM and LDL-receptor class A domain-containing protein 2 isoform X2 [Syngnathoides biaculeatus]|uniref:MAM and LDL-receptor class A domain-containing protein 2 isoform X2 n=1 Tax=Syngnathoides biaculeatus TaxID=300417 RepID=UPI002ADD4173|nr:MAM and LDL-receptor class A domain-containing protein 2 isoform X2 [Syngnathoides biaculeatus]